MFSRRHRYHKFYKSIDRRYAFSLIFREHDLRAPCNAFVVVCNNVSLPTCLSFSPFAPFSKIPSPNLELPRRVASRLPFLYLFFCARQVFSLAFQVPRNALSRFNLLAMHKALCSGLHRRRRRCRGRRDALQHRAR